jgi:hypothetical protein
VSKKPARTWQQPSDVSPVDATRFEAARDTDGVLRGFGHFQLAKMPDSNIVPATTKDTSPKLSGKVSLRPLP